MYVSLGQNCHSRQNHSRFTKGNPGKSGQQQPLQGNRNSNPNKKRISSGLIVSPRAIQLDILTDNFFTKVLIPTVTLKIGEVLLTVLLWMKMWQGNQAKDDRRNNY